MLVGKRKPNKDNPPPLPQVDQVCSTTGLPLDIAAATPLLLLLLLPGLALADIACLVCDADGVEATAAAAAADLRCNKDGGNVYSW